jgi:hypothetical protein
MYIITSAHYIYPPNKNQSRTPFPLFQSFGGTSGGVSVPDLSNSRKESNLFFLPPNPVLVCQGLDPDPSLVLKSGVLVVERSDEGKILGKRRRARRRRAGREAQIIAAKSSITVQVTALTLSQEGSTELLNERRDLRRIIETIQPLFNKRQLAFEGWNGKGDVQTTQNKHHSNPHLLARTHLQPD